MYIERISQCRNVKKSRFTYLNSQDEDGAVLSASEDEVVVGSNHQGRHRTGVHGEFEARRHVLRQRPVIHAHPTAVWVFSDQHIVVIVMSVHNVENEAE